VERLRFDADAAFTPQEELLDKVTLAPLTSPLAAGAPVQAAVFRLGAGGRTARHPATLPQILAVLEGSGRVSGADGDFESIRAGQAVFWTEGEEHEVVADEGMTALVLEGPGLEPFHGRQSVA
jgi:quercetin dioxygenase-like cupin family protein